MVLLGGTAVAGATARGTAPVGRPATVTHVTDAPDYSTGAYPWAFDNYTYQEYVTGTRTTYYEHGTFTAIADPTSGTPLSTPVHGTFEGVLVYTSAFPSGCGGCIPYAINFTYRAPKGWMFTELQTPGMTNYTQVESFPLEDAIP